MSVRISCTSDVSILKCRMLKARVLLFSHQKGCAEDACTDAFCICFFARGEFPRASAPVIPPGRVGRDKRLTSSKRCEPQVLHAMSVSKRLHEKTQNGQSNNHVRKVCEFPACISFGTFFKSTQKKGLFNLEWNVTSASGSIPSTEIKEIPNHHMNYT